MKKQSRNLSHAPPECAPHPPTFRPLFFHMTLGLAYRSELHEALIGWIWWFPNCPFRHCGQYVFCIISFIRPGVSQEIKPATESAEHLFK